MENKNILLVVASVCLFFVIVVGVGLVLFLPRSSATTQTAGIDTQPLFDKNFDTFEFYKGTQEIPGLVEVEDTGEAPPKNDMTITIGEAESSGEVIIEKKEQRTVTPDFREETASTEPAARPERREPRPTVATASAKRPQKVYVKEYEIQVGAYRTKHRADSVNTLLGDIGLAGTIRTRDIDGVTFFRVRIGPYSNQNEASKFLTWIKDVKGLEQSYISQVTRQRTIN